MSRITIEAGNYYGFQNHEPAAAAPQDFVETAVVAAACEERSGDVVDIQCNLLKVDESSDLGKDRLEDCFLGAEGQADAVVRAGRAGQTVTLVPGHNQLADVLHVRCAGFHIDAYEVGHIIPCQCDYANSAAMRYAADDSGGPQRLVEWTSLDGKRLEAELP